VGFFVGEDDVCVECVGAQDANGVVVREHQVTDGFVGVLAQCGQPFPGGGGGGQGFEGDEEVFSFDGSHVGVAFGGECVDPVGQDLQGLFLDRKSTRLNSSHVSI